MDDEWYARTFDGELREREDAMRAGRMSYEQHPMAPLNESPSKLNDEVAAALAIGGNADEALSQLAADADAVEREGWALSAAAIEHTHPSQDSLGVDAEESEGMCARMWVSVYLLRVASKERPTSDCCRLPTL